MFTRRRRRIACHKRTRGRALHKKRNFRPTGGPGRRCVVRFACHDDVCASRLRRRTCGKILCTRLLYRTMAVGRGARRANTVRRRRIFTRGEAEGARIRDAVLANKISSSKSGRQTFRTANSLENGAVAVAAVAAVVVVAADIVVRYHINLSLNTYISLVRYRGSRFG